MKNILSNLKAYFHTYDPANFNLIYAAKSALGLAVVLEAAFLLIDLNSLIFAIFASVFMFYMNSFNAKGWGKFAYLSGFGIACSLLALIVPAISELGVYMVFACFVWVFLATLSAGISDDLHKISIYTTLLLMAMLISSSLNHFDSYEAAKAIALGSAIGIIFRCYSPYSYGSYTRKSLSVILDDLAYLAKELNSSEYDEWKSVVAKRIEDYKAVLASKSATIKDASLVRNQEMAMFYICKCEEISYALAGLRVFFRRNKSNGYIKTIQAEIIANLLELKRIFKDEKPNLKTACLKRLEQLQTLPILHESLSVLYYKMQLFASGGSQKISFSKPARMNVNDFLKLFKYSNKYFRYALKCALACSVAMLIATASKIDHGIWIAMGTFTLFKEKINSTKINNKDTLIGSLAGFALGLCLIFLLAKSMFVYALLFCTYSLSIYFRHFPQRIATVFIMMNLAVFFCAVGLDYERLILYRLADFIVAYFIVLGFSLLWPAKSEHELKPATLTVCELLKDFLSAAKFKNAVELEPAIEAQITHVKELLIETRTKNNSLAQSKILETLLNLNNLSINLANYLENHASGAKERNDIDIIITRFNMLLLSSQSLPSYMYENISDKLLSEDEKIRFYCKMIFNEQSKLYKYLLN